jgi:NodT family efflux transporter outer membrane factor (OMF) lipoprotein
MKSKVCTVAACVLLSACAVGPNYKRPPVETPPSFKETEGWTPARPSDDADRGAWWSVFADPTLDDLERRIEISNQNLAASEAAYRQARALVAEQRAGLFPTVDLTGSATRSKRGSGGVTTTAGGVVAPAGRAANSYQVVLGGSWAPDLWGKIRRGIEGAKASAQASAADLANARLSAQSELAADYIQLRLADAQKDILQQTADGYARSLQITRNRYSAGVAAKSDVLQAQTQLVNAQASLVDMDRQRTQSEHAIAVLIGRPPADLTIPVLAGWGPTPPPTPVETPSTLLQRRPDVAAAERRAAAASAQIGVQVAAYFPSLTLSATGDTASTMLETLFNTSNGGWSIGANVAQTVFDAGAISSRVRESRAAYDQAVAQYRQTVLAAFGQVEDDLAAARVLQAEAVFRDQAVQSANEAEQIALNQYRAGQIVYTDVVVAQATALAARQALLTIQTQRITTAISLIEALGGGWTPPDRPAPSTG